MYTSGLNRVSKFFHISEESSSYFTDSFFFISEDEREAFEERAAIIEFEGGLIRDEAENIAYKCIIDNRSILAKAG